MTSIAAAVAQIIGRPAPVISADTCNFLDLFRCDTNRKQPRVPPGEIQIACELRQLVAVRPGAAHLVVPELVPGEFADHADRIEGEFDGWLRFHDQNQDWVTEAAVWVGTAVPPPPAVHPLGLCARLRGLANR
jgi:hypothetical protein